MTEETERLEGEVAPLAIARPAQVAAFVPRFVLPIDQMVQASDDMTEFQKRIMKEGVHYGKQPGTDKPTLFKPGAELLLSRMALHAANPVILSEVIDYGEADANGAVIREGLIRFSVQVNVYHQTGMREDERILVGSGVGACTTRETKYRWRNDRLKCPVCGKATIIKQKDFSGANRDMGWVCWQKQGRSDGCGEKFPPGDAQIADQPVGKVLNAELGELENTIFKMAKKRALIDATLVATGCSNVFTQDVGDTDTDDDDKNPPPPAPTLPKMRPEPPVRRPEREVSPTVREVQRRAAANARPEPEDEGEIKTADVAMTANKFLALKMGRSKADFAEWVRRTFPGAAKLPTGEGLFRAIAADPELYGAIKGELAIVAAQA